MVRQIFMGRLKKGISKEIKDQAVADMLAMKDKIPGIIDVKAGISTGWNGLEDEIVLTVDLPDKDAFEAYLTHPYHAGHIVESGAEYLEHGTCLAVQFEF